MIGGHKWDGRFMAVAETVATWSKDPSAKVGALLVAPDGRMTSWGFNGFPRGVSDDGRLQVKSSRLALTVHAEMNALLNCPVDPVGWTLYVTKHPCLECAKAIIQKGIERVVCPDPAGSWSDEQTEARDLLREAGATVQAPV
jgi:dCMP deaminase